MNIAVLGLWHLGTVYASVLASGGHSVVAIDDEATISDLRSGALPVNEPGLADLIRDEQKLGRLHFTSQVEAIKDSPLVWVCYDTPTSPGGEGDVEFVMDRVADTLPHAKRGSLILVSSQLPAGSVAELRSRHHALCAERNLSFGYSPENLRLGSAIEYFQNPDRIVVGLEDKNHRSTVKEALKPFASRVVWMSPSSAEMVKHAINTFFATSIAFTNEIATLCEAVGADAQDVEAGLKSDERIGARAYLHPGPAFAGGTLLRDLRYLLKQGTASHKDLPLLNGVVLSNEYHKSWDRRALKKIIGDPRGKRIAVLGLTYKPGTNTLRGSASLEFCEWAAEHGGIVRAYDPAIRELPSPVADLKVCDTAQDALSGADVAIVNTSWPEFRELTFEDFASTMSKVVVIDAGRFLETILTKESGLRQVAYIAIGRADSANVAP